MENKNKIEKTEKQNLNSFFVSVCVTICVLAFLITTMISDIHKRNYELQKYSIEMALKYNTSVEVK